MAVSFAAADLTGSRRPCFVVSGPAGGVVAVDGQTGKVLARASHPHYPVVIATADLDGDGRVEVICAPSGPVEGPAELTVMRLSSTHFTIVATHTLAPELFSRGCTIAAGCFGPSRSSRWIAVAPRDADEPTILFFKLSSTGDIQIAAAPLSPTFAAPGFVRGLSLAAGPVRGCRFFSELLVAPLCGLARTPTALQMFSLHAQPHNQQATLPLLTAMAPLREGDASASSKSLPSFQLVAQMPTASLPAALFGPAIASAGSSSGPGLSVAVCASTCTHGAVALWPAAFAPTQPSITLLHGFGLPAPSPVAVELVALPAAFAGAAPYNNNGAAAAVATVGVCGAGMMSPLSAAGAAPTSKQQPVPGPARPVFVAFEGSGSGSGASALHTASGEWIPLNLGAVLADSSSSADAVPGWRALSGKESGSVGCARLLGWEEGVYPNPYRVELQVAKVESSLGPLVSVCIGAGLAVPSSAKTFSVPIDAHSPLMEDPMALVDSNSPDPNAWYQPGPGGGFSSWGPHSSPSSLAFPRPTLKELAHRGHGAAWLRQRILAHALALCDGGLDYQHHHTPFFGSSPLANDAGRRFSPVFAGRHTQGLDCSNMTAFVMICALGLRVSSAIGEQSEQVTGDLNPPPPSPSGTTKAVGLPRIHAARVPLPAPAATGPALPFELLTATLQPGDLLFIQKGARGAARDKPIGHVVMWVGPSLGRKVQATVEGKEALEPACLIIDSHGGGPPIADCNGLVTPFGPALREMRPDSWYHDRFSHALRWVHDDTNGSNGNGGSPCCLWDTPTGPSPKLHTQWASAAARAAGDAHGMNAPPAPAPAFAAAPPVYPAPMQPMPVQQVPVPGPAPDAAAMAALFPHHPQHPHQHHHPQQQQHNSAVDSGKSYALPPAPGPQPEAVSGGCRCVIM